MKVLEAINNIKSYTLNLDYNAFKQDKKTFDAVIRNLEVIGEAAKNIPDTIKKQNSEVNWRAISGMRDKLIHEYFGINKQIVWETIKSDLPDLELKIKNILEEVEK